jgi:Cd2+/Zn2+-exporting ATPase
MELLNKIFLFNNKKELVQIITAGCLFIGGVVVEGLEYFGHQQILHITLFIAAYVISGWNVLFKAIKNSIRGNYFDENFLMSIATIGAIAIGELSEAAMVMLLYNIGELFQKSAVKSSRNSIKALLEIRPEYANVLENGEIKRKDPSELKINEIVLVKPGEKIPLDGKILSGDSYVDTFILTGESIPKPITTGDSVLAGMINKSGAIEIVVTKLFSESSIAKIMHMVEYAAHKKAKTERFMTKFARVYSPIVVGAAALIAFVPPLLFTAETFSDWIYRALVVLVVSCPCALVISIPLSYFGGLGSASRRGILIKGSNFLDALNEVTTVVFDKTGTLTKGVFKVTEVVSRNGFGNEEILKLAYLAEINSNHPIAESIRQAYGKELKIHDQVDHQEISGLGIKVKISDKTIIVGNDKLLHKENIDHDDCKVEGTVIHVAVNSVYAGHIIISDELKHDSVAAIENLKKMGIRKTIMLSGDNEYATSRFAEKLKLDQSYSELLPEDKVMQLEQIISENKSSKVAFVGDGINDAPVIARSDLGIAMGGLGSDAAVEAADIVIMEDHPSKVAEAILIARKTRKIVLQNLIFSIAVKIIFILLGSFGVATMWEAVFGDMGVALIAILNATRIFKI